MDTEVTDEPLRNWLKSCLAINHITSAIRPFIKKLFEDQFQENVQNVIIRLRMDRYECTSCDPDKVKPYHAMSGQCSFPRKRGRCNCVKENTIPCPSSNACGLLYDIMTKDHIAEEPIWSNSKHERLSSSACEQMKCYISCTGYRDVSNVNQMEITEIYQICTNSTSLLRTLDVRDIRMLAQVKNDHRELVCGSPNASADKFKECVSNINLLVESDTCIVDRDNFIWMEMKKLEEDKVKITICEEIYYLKKALDVISKAKAELQHETVGDRADHIRQLETVELMQKQRLQQQTEVFIHALCSGSDINLAELQDNSNLLNGGGTNETENHTTDTDEKLNPAHEKSIGENCEDSNIKVEEFDRTDSAADALGNSKSKIESGYDKSINKTGHSEDDNNSKIGEREDEGITSEAEYTVTDDVNAVELEMEYADDAVESSADAAAEENIEMKMTEKTGPPKSSETKNKYTGLPRPVMRMWSGKSKSNEDSRASPTPGEDDICPRAENSEEDSEGEGHSRSSKKGSEECGPQEEEKDPHQQSFLNLKPGMSKHLERTDKGAEAKLADEFNSRKRLCTRKKVSYVEEVEDNEDEDYDAENSTEEAEDHMIDLTNPKRKRSRTNSRSLGKEGGGVTYTGHDLSDLRHGVAEGVARDEPSVSEQQVPDCCSCSAKTGP